MQDSYEAPLTKQAQLSEGTNKSMLNSEVEDSKSGMGKTLQVKISTTVMRNVC